MADEERVAAFMKAWGLEADGIRDDLLALLKSVRDEARKDNVGAQLMAVALAAFDRVSKRARDLFVRLAPPGTVITESLKDHVRREMAAMIIDELTTSGMSEQHASVIAAVMSMAIKLKEKQ